MMQHRKPIEPTPTGTKRCKFLYGAHRKESVGGWLADRSRTLPLANPVEGSKKAEGPGTRTHAGTAHGSGRGTDGIPYAAPALTSLPKS